MFIICYGVSDISALLCHDRGKTVVLNSISKKLGLGFPLVKPHFARLKFHGENLLTLRYYQANVWANLINQTLSTLPLRVTKKDKFMKKI